MRILLLSLLLLSCSKTNVEIYCTKIYAPVCANGTLYANACLAQKAGHENKDIEQAIEVESIYVCKSN